jgi:sugar/nucleoside kinase (ribokinase family)
MPNKIVVAGVTSLYMSMGVEQFPVQLAHRARPTWMRCGVTGAAGHIAQILQRLGDDVQLCTIAGRDAAGRAIRADLQDRGLLGRGVVEGPASSLGVVLVAPDGSRTGYPYLAAVNTAEFPAEVFCEYAQGADLAVMTNARFVQPLIEHATKFDLPIAVDVHLISDVDDEYNRPWLEAADIVFCSHERLPCPPEEWVARIFKRYPGCEMAGIGLGPDGCLLGLRDGTLIAAPAIVSRGVVNTSGAGDALFASFLHGWLATGNPVGALESAAMYAGWKIGDSFPGASLLTESDLAKLKTAHPVRATMSRWDTESRSDPGRAVTPAQSRQAASDGFGSGRRPARQAG